MGAAAVAVGFGLFLIVTELLGRGGKVQEEAPALSRFERHMVTAPLPVLPEKPESGGPKLRNVAGAVLSPAARLMGEERKKDLATQLEVADLKLRPEEWLLAQGVVGLVVGAAVWLRLSWFLGLAAGILVPYVGGGLFIAFRRRKKIQALARQLPDVLMQLANGLRAGLAFPQGMRAVAATARAPLGTEFARTLQEIELGMPTDVALHRLAERSGSDDVDLMVTAVIFSRAMGGNLSDILEKIANTVRDRVRIRGEIRTLTAQARLSGWIISLLPIALAFFLSMIAPTYFDPILQDPLGLAMLVGSGLSMMIGWAAIRRIVNIPIW